MPRRYSRSVEIYGRGTWAQRKVLAAWDSIRATDRTLDVGDCVVELVYEYGMSLL